MTNLDDQIQMDEIFLGKSDKPEFFGTLLIFSSILKFEIDSRYYPNIIFFVSVKDLKVPLKEKLQKEHRLHQE